MSDEITRLVTELEQTRQDLLAANERIQLARKESDRLRAQSADIRAEHSQLLADETQRRVSAETQCTQLKAEVEREKRLRRDAEASANDAAQEQRRHVEFVQDARRQFETRLTTLVQQLRQREEQVHNLEYQVRDRDRERQRADALEQIVAKREASLQSLSAELVGIRKESTQLSAQLMTAQQKYEISQEHVQRLKEEILAQKENSAASSPGSPNGGKNGSPFPPPPPVDEDPHVMETARLVTFTRDWVKDTVKDFGALHAECDHLVQLVSDTSMILEKGSSQAGLDLAAADRRRQQQLRELENMHVNSQMMQLEGVLPSTTVVRNGLSDVKFQVSRVATGLQGAVDAVRAIRTLADKYCSQIGLPIIQQKLDRIGAPQPPPLPTPVSDRHNFNVNNANNNSSSNTASGTNTPSDAVRSPTGQNAPQQMPSNNNSSSSLHQHHHQQQHSSPPSPVSPQPVGLRLEDFISLQQQLSKAEVTASSEKAKLESEIMTAKMHLQMEKDRGVAEKEKTIFDCERKFSEERRDLQRKIDEGEMKLMALERKHEDDIRRKEMESHQKVSAVRDELLEESRQLRDQCRTLEREQQESAELIVGWQAKLQRATGDRKEALQEAKRLENELREEAQRCAKLTMELRLAQEACDELGREVDSMREREQEMMAASMQNNNGRGGMMEDTSGLAGFGGGGGGGGGGGNMFADWQRRSTGGGGAAPASAARGGRGGGGGGGVPARGGAARRPSTPTAGSLNRIAAAAARRTEL